MNTTETTSTAVQNIPTIYPYITSEDFTREDVEDYPGTYDWDGEEDGPYFEDVAIEVTEKAFQSACLRLKPLLDKFPIHDLVVGIDIYGMEGNAPITHFSTKTGKDGKVTANFLMGAGILEYLLSEHFQEDFNFNWKINQAFDNALIRSMDYGPDTHQPLPMASISPLAYFVSFLSGIRNIGLDELGFYLNPSRSGGDLDVADPGYAGFLEAMKENLAKGNGLLEETELLVEKLRPGIYKQSPALLLHAVYVYAKERGEVRLAGLAEKVLKSEAGGLADEERLNILCFALQMNSVDFLLSLKKPGCTELSYPLELFDETLQLLYADHEKNRSRYAEAITTAARENVESLTTSFHNLNEGFPEDQRMSEDSLNRNLDDILHDESALLELAEKLHRG